MPTFKENETKDLPFDPKNVGASCAGRFTFNAAGDWRWITAEENKQYELAGGYDHSHDHARADDDGMGAAVGAQTAPDDNDLGADWGKSSVALDATTAKIANDEEAKWEYPRGQMVPLEVEKQLADKAAAFIQATVGKSMKQRYTLIIYNLADVDPVTTAATITSTTTIATADTNSLLAYANQELERLYAAQAETAMAGLISANELEV